MFRRIRIYIRNWPNRPLVRPWGLVAPVLVLLLCLPLLRPLRHPGQASDDELTLLSTVHSLVDHQTLALDPARDITSANLIRAKGQLYSAEPPVYAVLLSGMTRVIGWFGLPLGDSDSFATYLLTLFGATLPVTLTAALLYRMGRLFELKRHWRALLALAAVFGSGLVSYAVVLNPHAAAACLLIGSVGCLIHVESSRFPRRSAGWIVVSGACASLAAALDPLAAIIGAMLILVIAATRFSLRFRLGGILLYLLGAVPFTLLHANWNVPMTGDIVPGYLHPELSAGPIALGSQPLGPVDLEADDQSFIKQFFDRAGDCIGKVMSGLIGEHGILSHFPVLIVGVFGVFAVMHRHWPTPVKLMAGAALVGGAVILIGVSLTRVDWNGAMFANRFLVVFLPLLMFWAGAWVRRPHSAMSWSLAGIALMASIFVSIIGSTDPYPRGGFDRYTATQAFSRLIHGSPPEKSTIISKPTAALVRQ
jgi:hypothetical protein